VSIPRERHEAQPPEPDSFRLSAKHELNIAVGVEFHHLVGA
jgi:hypothetical protein